MGVSVVEARKYGFRGKINLSRARASQTQHLSVRAHGNKSRATYSHRLSPRLGFIQRPDVPVIQNGFRLFDSQERQHQKAAHTLHEIPPREWSHYSTSRKAQAVRVSGILRRTLLLKEPIPAISKLDFACQPSRHSYWLRRSYDQIGRASCRER